MNPTRSRVVEEGKKPLFDVLLASEGTCAVIAPSSIPKKAIIRYKYVQSEAEGGTSMCCACVPWSSPSASSART